MRFANMMDRDDLELKAVAAVAASYLLLATVFLSGLL
jgi:hypothetical protein